MTSLINISSDMRKRINERLYTTKLCIDYLGTANPGPAEIRNFKESWPLKYKVAIDSVHKAKQLLADQEIPPLLYDIRSNNWDWAGDEGAFGGSEQWWGNAYGDAGPNKYIVFYEEEDYILFKLLYKNA